MKLALNYKDIQTIMITSEILDIESGSVGQNRLEVMRTGVKEHNLQ